MGGLFGGGGTTISTTQQQLAGIQLQTSAYGITIPVLFGKNRMPVNLVYFNDFVAIPHTESQTSGGKGGGGGVTQTNTWFTYEGAVIRGICKGPVTAFGRMWEDKDIYSVSQWSNWTRSLGAYGQAVWTYLTSAHPTEADPYSGLCWAAIQAYHMGTTATLRNASVEIVGFNPVNYGVNDNASPLLTVILYY